MFISCSRKGFSQCENIRKEGVLFDENKEKGFDGKFENENYFKEDDFEERREKDIAFCKEGKEKNFKLDLNFDMEKEKK